MNYSTDRVSSLMTEFASSGQLSQKQFLQLLSSLTVNGTQEDLHEAFLLLDTDNSGSLQATELLQILRLGDRGAWGEITLKHMETLIAAVIPKTPGELDDEGF